MDFKRVVVVAFATGRVVDTVKEVLPVIPDPWAKSVFAGAVGSGLALLSAEDRRPQTVALTGLAAAGLAAVLHDIQMAASAFADNNVTEVLQRVPRRAPQPGGAAGPLR